MGRKRISGKRVNGRLSQAAEDIADRQAQKFLKSQSQLEAQEREMLGIGTAARIRVWGVKPSDSRSQMAGCFVGRVCLRGELTVEQYDALIGYQRDSLDFRQAIGAPRDASAVDLNATHGSNGDYEPLEFIAKAKERMVELRKAIGAAQAQVGMTANLWAALDLCVMRDVDLPHMIGDLRVAANALCKFYKLERRDAA